MKSLPGQQLLKAYRPGFRAGQSSVYRTRLELKLVQSKSKRAVPQLGFSGCRVHAYAFCKSSKLRKMRNNYRSIKCLYFIHFVFECSLRLFTARTMPSVLKYFNLLLLFLFCYDRVNRFSFNLNWKSLQKVSELGSVFLLSVSSLRN